ETAAPAGSRTKPETRAVDTRVASPGRRLARRRLAVVSAVARSGAVERRWRVTRATTPSPRASTRRTMPARRNRRLRLLLEREPCARELRPEHLAVAHDRDDLLADAGLHDTGDVFEFRRCEPLGVLVPDVDRPAVRQRLEDAAC